MNKNSLMEQAALYSLGALSEVEAREFAKVLATDSDLRVYLRELEEAAATLAFTVPQQEVPDQLQSKILSAIAKEKKTLPFPEPSMNIPSKSKGSTQFFAIILPWALAACLAVFCGILAKKDHQIGYENHLWQLMAKNMESQCAQTEMARLDLKKQLATAASDARLANIKLETLTSQLNSSYFAAIAWDEKSQEGIMRIRKLPSAAAGKSYQLWVIDPKDPLPISAGVFTVASDGSAQIKFSPIRPVGAAKTFAVSLEKEGGSSTTPQGPIVLVN